MLKRLYEWTLEKAAHRFAERWLAFLAFIESSFFPIPPDAMLIPMSLANPRRAFRFAAVCTFFSVAGAALGWVIGAAFFETIGEPLLNFYGAQAHFEEIRTAFNREGVAIVFLAGFTPIPFKVITIASGMTGMSIWAMLGASVVGRGGRFFLVALLLRLFGERVKGLIDRYFGLLTLAAGILLIGGFVVIRWLL